MTMRVRELSPLSNCHSSVCTECLQLSKEVTSEHAVQIISKTKHNSQNKFIWPCLSTDNLINLP